MLETIIWFLRIWFFPVKIIMAMMLNSVISSFDIFFIDTLAQYFTFNKNTLKKYRFGVDPLPLDIFLCVDDLPKAKHIL